jgi:hypothetical protein
MNHLPADNNHNFIFVKGDAGKKRPWQEFASLPCLDAWTSLWMDPYALFFCVDSDGFLDSADPVPALC